MTCTVQNIHRVQEKGATIFDYNSRILVDFYIFFHQWKQVCINTITTFV